MIALNTTATSVMRAGIVSACCLAVLGTTRLGMATEVVAKPALPAGITIFDTSKGPVFATAQGMTIYKAIPKGRAAAQVEVSGECIIQCQNDWPPLKAPPGAKPVGEFTVAKGAGGIDQWAYKGVLLETFKYDRHPGDTLGDDTFDFNCLSPGQRRDANGRSGMLSSLAENLNHQIGEAVNRLWLVDKRWGRIYKSQHLYDPFHLVEIAEHLFQDRQLVQRGQLRAFITVLNG